MERSKREFSQVLIINIQYQYNNVIFNISLTIEGITKTFARRKFVLSIVEFPGTHSGEAIAKKIKQILQDWNIEKDRIVAFVRDSGSNIKKVVQLLSIKYLSIKKSNIA